MYHRNDGSKCVVLGYYSTYFPNKIQKGKACCSKEQVISMLEFLILSSNSRYKSKNDADEAASVISLISSSGGYFDGRNSANLELLIDKTSSIYLYVKLKALIYDKRDDFNFKIINFPNICSNIPASPAYGVYISQLIRYGQ
jgi:hypothetical protein